MFESKELIFVQLQKTGCSHITSLLQQLFDGQRLGNHRAANAEQLASGKTFLASIRNPWDWYVSLWSYGVQGEGSLRRSLIKKKPSSYLRYAIQNPSLHTWQSVYAEITKDVELWRSCYTQSDDVAAFRRWLALILDAKKSLRHYLTLQSLNALRAATVI